MSISICVYGAASNRIDKKYIENTEILGKELASRGYDLVFGGGGVGNMGAAARGFHAGGGKVIGVIPRFFREQNIEDLYEKCDKFIYTYTLAERKTIMEDSASAFVITPGGVGTYDEFFEALTLTQLGRMSKPIAIFNVDGFYDPLKQMMQNAKEQNFLREGIENLYGIFDNAIDLADYISSKL